MRATYTPLGETIRKLQEEAYKGLKDWAKKLPAGPLPVPDQTHSDKALSEKMKAQVNEVFQQKEAGAALQFDPPDKIMVHWKRIDDKLRFQYPVKLFIPLIDPQFMLEGYVTVESETSLDPHNLPPAEVHWDVVSLEWERKTPAVVGKSP